MNISFHVSSIGELHIQPGDTVDFNTPLAKKTVAQEIRVEVSDELGISPDKIFMHLLKVVGEEVIGGEILAQKKSVVGRKKVKSPYAGVIKEVNHESGYILIEALSASSTEQKAYFTGQIAEIKNNVVTLKVKNSKTFPLKDVTEDFGGEVMFTDENTLISLQEESVLNKVIFIDWIKASEAVRLDVLGVSGIITSKDITEKEGINTAQLKNASDWEEIKKLEYRYCIVDKKNATIILYQ